MGQNSAQGIGTLGAIDWQTFTIGADTYAMVANLVNGSSYLTNSYLYKWMSTNKCFGNGLACANTTLGENALQTIATAGASDWQTVTIGTETYAMVANEYNDSSYLTNSYLYKWMPGSNCFGNGTSCANLTLGANALQAIATAGAFDWHTVTIGTETYAMVANEYNGSSVLMNSYIYKWMPGSNCFGNGSACANTTLGINALQTIATAGAYDWQTVTIGTDTYVLVANHYNGTSYLTNSYLYKWMPINNCFGNGTSCANSILGANALQAIATAGPRDWHTVTIGADTYALVANHHNDSSYLNNSYLYKWMPGSNCFGNGTNCANLTLGANALQAIATAGALDWNTVSIGTNVYALVANYNNDTSNLTNSYLYKWTGTGFGTDNVTTTPQTITTTPTSQKDTSTWGTITNITTTQNTPTNTNIKYLVSFDNKATWKYWNGSTWQTSDISNIETNGMTKEIMEGLTTTAWNATGGLNSHSAKTLDIATSLATTSTSANPSLDNIQISYTTSQTQTLTSNIYNTELSAANLNSLAWTANTPNNTTVKFQIRTAQDATTITTQPWCGPDNNDPGSCDSTTYFTQPTDTIDNTQKDRQNDQYFQYKVFLTSTDGQSTPTLSDVTVNYTTIIPPTVTTNTAENITPTQATINANLTTTGGENPTRNILWGTQENTLTNTCTQGTGSEGIYSCTLTNLTPNTQYFFQAQATNAAGTANGDTLNFITQDIPEEVTITNPQTTDIEQATTNQYFHIQQGNPTNTQAVKTNTTINLTTTNAQVTLPPNTTITETNDNSFNFTQFQTTNTTNQTKQFTPSLAAVKLGVPNTRMEFSNPITLTLFVGEAYNNRDLNILYQEDGETTWNAHSTPTCTITNGNCTFTTTHATTYTVNGDGTISGANNNDITTDVQDVLSLDCTHDNTANDHIVEFGNLTPGTPVTASTTCTVTTNSDQGYTLAVKRNDPDSTMDKDTDSTANITDRTNWDPTGTGNAQTWQTNDTNLAFTLYSTTATKDTTWWGTGTTQTDANNKYAGFPTDYTNIMNHTQYNQTATTTNIGYKLDVPTTQKSGIYSGDITYQVTTAP